MCHLLQISGIICHILIPATKISALKLMCFFSFLGKVASNNPPPEVMWSKTDPWEQRPANQRELVHYPANQVGVNQPANRYPANYPAANQMPVHYSANSFGVKYSNFVTERA